MNGILAPNFSVSIAKTFRYEAAHQLVNSGTPCDHVHGHSYRFEVRLSGPVATDGPTNGMLLNFSNISAIVKREIVELLDHKFVSARNQEPMVQDILIVAGVDYSESLSRETLITRGVVTLDIPTTTAEWMARWIGEVLAHHLHPHSVAIRFWETETGMAEYHVPARPPSQHLTHYDRIAHRATLVDDLAAQEAHAAAPHTHAGHTFADGSPAFRETC